MQKELGKTRKELAGRYYQLLSGHAATADRLVRVGQALSNRCWECGSGERQSRYHLLVRCRRWVPEIRWLWQRVQVDCEWPAPRASMIRALIGDSRATPALLEFLSDTRVGWMPSQVVLRGGGAEDDDEGLEIELWAPQEGAVDEGSEEEDGPGQPF